MWVNPIYILLIFVSWIICGYLGGNDTVFSGQLIFPVIWSGVFLLLKSRGYKYIAQVAYLLFLLMSLADGLNFGFGSYRSNLAYLSFTIGFALSWQFMFSNSYRLGKYGQMWIVPGSILSTLSLLVLPITFIVYSFSFGTGMSRDVIYAILATNKQESVEFGTVFISPKWVILFIACLGFVTISLIRQKASQLRSINHSPLLVQLVVLAVILGTQLDHFHVFKFPASCIYHYQKELSSFRLVQASVKSDEILFEAIKQEQGETYVVVIGESLSKHHMSLYGYPRSTNPLLEDHATSRDLLVFNKAFSSHTHTAETLSLSFTEANQLNRKNYFESLSLLNILKKAKVETTWITNQILHGSWDNLISVIAHQADVLIPYNQWVGKVIETRYPDEVLLEPLVEIFSKPTQANRVIFVHLMGNHSEYEQRYPAPFNVFPDDQDMGAHDWWTDLSEEVRQTVNYYDNSVLYNDFVISSMLDSLKEIGGVTGLLYFSDHGEDVIGERYHHSDLFTFEMVQIPLIAWFSSEYQARYPKQYDNLLSHSEEFFCNDSLYDTLIGIFNIESDRYDARHDLSSEQYELLLDDALTLHGTVKYEDAFKSEETREKAEALVRAKR